MKGFSYIPGVATLALDDGLCTGCGICLQVCPHGVFFLGDGAACIADLDSCMECGACALNCPVRAISVNSGVGCASGMINRWLDRFNIRMSNDDSCC